MPFTQSSPGVQVPFSRASRMASGLWSGGTATRNRSQTMPRLPSVDGIGNLPGDSLLPGGIVELRIRPLRIVAMLVADVLRRRRQSDGREQEDEQFHPVLPGMNLPLWMQVQDANRS
jgi:hypothetical protein